MVTTPGVIDRRRAVALQKGASFNWSLVLRTTTGTPINLTGARFTASIYNSRGDEVMTFDSEASPATILIPTPTNGGITLTQTSETMAAQNWTTGTLLLRQIGPALDVDGSEAVTVWMRAAVVLVPQNQQAT